MTRKEIEATWEKVQSGVALEGHRLKYAALKVDVYEEPNGVRVAQLSQTTPDYRVSDANRNFPRDFIVDP